MRHRNNFDALRLLGAMLVLVSHQYGLADRPEPNVWPTVSLGTFGVFMFFSISGYLVSKSWLADPDPYRFTLRRFLRIWPGMAVALIVSLVFVTTLVTRQWSMAVPYLSNLACPGCADGQFFPGNRFGQLYGSLWTIPLEIQCYALLMFAALMFKHRLRICMKVAIGLLIAQAIASIAAIPWLTWPVGQMGAFFLMGCLLGLNEAMVRKPLIPVLSGLLVVAAGALTIGLALSLSVAVVYVGNRSWPLLRDAGRWGDYSYGVYLYAWPVQQYLVWKLGKQASIPELMTTSIVVTFALAFASWHLVEARALRFKPYRPSGPVGTPASTRGLT